TPRRPSRGFAWIAAVRPFARFVLILYISCYSSYGFMPRREIAMTPQRAGADASTATPEPKRSGVAASKRHLKSAQPATSDMAFQQTNNPPGNSEEIARLCAELVTSFGANDAEAVRLAYRELLRLGRPRAEILAEVARIA